METRYNLGRATVLYDSSNVNLERLDLQAIITGAGGFAGSHLAEYLLNNTDQTIWGCGQSLAPILRSKTPFNYHCIDLTNPHDTMDFIERTKPDYIYHLAGQAEVHTSWEEPKSNYDANVYAALNILDAIWKLKIKCRMLVVTSMEVYGKVSPNNMPIKEDSCFRPNSPYSASKAAEDLLAQAYFLGHGLDIIRVRPLNHIGPRQSDQFVATAFARQLARIELGQQPPTILVGNLSDRRDFTDVRDMVKAYALTMEYGESGSAYNIASGNMYSIKELLETLIDLSNTKVTIKVDSKRVRSSSTPPLIADCTSFKKITGWEPEITLQETLSDLLNFERNKLKSENMERDSVRKVTN